MRRRVSIEALDQVPQLKDRLVELKGRLARAQGLSSLGLKTFLGEPKKVGVVWVALLQTCSLSSVSDLKQLPFFFWGGGGGFKDHLGGTQ